MRPFSIDYDSSFTVLSPIVARLNVQLQNLHRFPPSFLTVWYVEAQA